MMRAVASKKAGWILGITLVVLLIAGLWAAAFALGRGVASPRPVGDWDEELIVEGESSDKVVMVSLFGEIFSDPEGFAPGASDENIVSQLDQAIDDPDIVGVILDLDTPGGAVVASDTIYRKVLALRKEDVAVVALMRDVAASGGYYIASAADEIIANPATITGSIGVIMIVPNLEGTAAKLGIKPLVIKSGPHKDIASPFREITPEERTILQGIIDGAYEQFIGAVAKGRKLDAPRVRELADGRIYTGKQAKDLGLVDRLGGRDLAFQRARKLAEAEDASLVRYTRSRGLAESLLGFSSEAARGNLVRRGLGIDLRPGLKYLWLP